MAITDADLKTEYKRLSDHVISTTTSIALRAAGASIELLLPHMLAKASLYTPMKGSPDVEFNDGGDILTPEQMIERLRADPNFGRLPDRPVRCRGSCDCW
ncbi:hypothetical protein [Hyphomicrobium sp.]|jgi:hypothetical protein|uniref:hypothetical protein n=1 Tax=Hyphomicrobium sp. TaxID=82 RepID=UPI0035658600